MVGLNHTSSPTHAIFCQYHWRLELFHCVETIGPVIKNKKNMQYVHMNSCWMYMVTTVIDYIDLFSRGYYLAQKQNILHV